MAGHARPRAPDRATGALAGLAWRSLTMCGRHRQCSSGLQAVADVVAAIKAGFYTIGIGAGVETMSQNPMAWEGGVNPRVSESQNAQNCLVPMGAPVLLRCGIFVACCTDVNVCIMNISFGIMRLPSLVLLQFRFTARSEEAFSRYPLALC